MFPQSTLDDVIAALLFDPQLGVSEIDLFPSDEDILEAISFNYHYPLAGIRVYEYEARLPLSDSVWSFNEECIYKEGDYIKVIESMMTLAGDNLPIEDIFVNFEIAERKIVRMRFELDNQEYDWELKLRFDWLDREILTNLSRLLSERNSLLRFAICRETEENGFIVCLTVEQIERLNQTTDLKFVVL